MHVTCAVHAQSFTQNILLHVCLKKNLWFPVMIMVPSTQPQKNLIIDTMSTLNIFFSFRRLTVLRNFFEEEFSNLLGVR